MLVRNAMRQVENYEIHPEQTLETAARMMIRHSLNALPVTIDNQLVGVIRLTDLLTAPLPHRPGARVSERRDEAQLVNIWRQMPVSHLMNEQVIAVGEDTPLMQAAALMVNFGRERLLVTRAGGVVGMITRADIVAALLTLPQAHLEPEFEPAAVQQPA